MDADHEPEMLGAGKAQVLRFVEPVSVARFIFDAEGQPIPLVVPVHVQRSSLVFAS